MRKCSLLKLLNGLMTRSYTIKITVLHLIVEWAKHNSVLQLLVNLWCKVKEIIITVFVSGAPEGIRIPDRRYRKPVLYPAELRTHIFKENEIIANKAYIYLS